MPGMDGFETVGADARSRRLRRGDGDHAVVRRPQRGQTPRRRLGVARCLTKPVTQSQLFNAIAQSLGTAVAEARPFDSIHSDRPSDFAPRRILLAEDGVVNQKVAIELLTKRGHHVTLANNGKEALSDARQAGFRSHSDGHPDADAGRLRGDRRHSRTRTGHRNSTYRSSR